VLRTGDPGSPIAVSQVRGRCRRRFAQRRQPLVRFARQAPAHGSTRLGPGSGVWYVIPAGGQKLRVHRRFFKDIEIADTQAAAD
jgi:hypothetical protein